jgi:hypothetical protein
MHSATEHAQNERIGERATPAGIVATAMGFLADFLVLREGQTNVDLSEFVDWLRRHDHRELAQRILSDPAIFSAFERAFTEGHGEIATKLEFLDEGLILLCGTEGILAEVARSLRPDLAAKVHGR